MSEEVFDGLSLCVVEEGEVGELFEVGDVDKELVRVDHVVVDVLKVA